MTSNIGSSHILEQRSGEAVEALVREELHRTFRPEFLNRVDATLVFPRLEPEAIRGIVDIQLSRVDVLLAARSIVIDVTDAVKDKLAALGYDPAFGARPLKRIIQQRILEPLSEKIIAGELKDGGKAAIDMNNGEISFSIAPSST
jgi:ATP-dependent Clp protease ATP-binding subunit ClpB